MRSVVGDQLIAEVDAVGNVYVADSNDNAVVLIPHSNSGYGTPINLGSGFSQPVGIALDASGNVYVADTGNGAVEQIPFSQGSYGTPIVLASGFNQPLGVAVDTAGNLYVADGYGNDVVQIPYSAGTYGTPITLGSSDCVGIRIHISHGCSGGYAGAPLRR